MQKEWVAREDLYFCLENYESINSNEHWKLIQKKLQIKYDIGDYRSSPPVMEINCPLKMKKLIWI